MNRFTTTALVALAMSLSAPALAESALDEKTPDAVATAAGEDAVILPAVQASKPQPANEQAPRRAPRGSSQSEAGFRFTNPYAYPQQTLPLQFPALATISF